ncbi:MAG: MaoC/PaaZ C-terminal domain-containing protein [Acidimicrobiia bacterium]
MAFNLDNLGKWSEEREFKVEADRIKAYAAATNDPLPRHTSGELAPPVFAVVPIWEAMGESVMAVTPPEVMLNALHGEQDMHFHQPIRPGMVLRSRAAPVGVHVKPSGTTVVTHTETRDEHGESVNEQWFVSFFRGTAEGDSAGEPAPDHAFAEDARTSDPFATATQRFDEDQTFRYRDASGDYVPIHVDEGIAKSIGLPGIIIHGLCTMAFTSWSAIEELADGEPSRLKRLAVRFSKPLFPGQEIITRFYSAGSRDARALYTYETTNPDGDLVIKDGLAEVS